MLAAPNYNLPSAFLMVGYFSRVIPRAAIKQNALQ